jgi:hypothetical protein
VPKKLDFDEENEEEDILTPLRPSSRSSSLQIRPSTIIKEDE